MPAYNCGKYIKETLQSVINQSYRNWEIIVVDDCSSDDTGEVVKRFMQSDNRIKYHRFNENRGAAAARNKAFELVNGKYIAFLDSDDIWFTDKLQKQIIFMKENDISFSCTAYNKIDENGNDLKRIIVPAEKINYEDLLKYCPGNSTVIYDAEKLGKYHIPDMRKRNDYILWLQIIKNAKVLVGFQDVLSSHRIRNNSVSSNKLSLVKYHWNIYRKMENQTFLKSCYLIIYWGIETVFRLR